MIAPPRRRPSADDQARHRPDDVRRHHALRQAVSQAARGDYDCLVFHATGTGGQSMEKLVDSGLIAGVLDITTTEVADHVVGRRAPGRADRIGAIARTGVPYVGSVGALDMVNFWARRHGARAVRATGNLHVHNPQVTLMRTTPEENAAHRQLDRRQAQSPARARCASCIPEGGVSVLDAPGQPFHDPAADAALFDAHRADVAPDAPPQLVSGCRNTSTTRRSPTALVDDLPRDRHDRETARDAWPAIARKTSSSDSAAMIDGGEPIIGGGAGTGLSAKCEEAGGIDLIVIYNSGRYRMAGRGSLAGLLAYGNANEIVVEMAREVLPVVKQHAGAGRRQRHRSVPAARAVPAPSSAALGFSGVQNFPTVGPDRRRVPARTSRRPAWATALEVEHDPRGRAQLDLLTTPYVFDPDEAARDGRGRRRHRRLPHGADHRRRRSAPRPR